MCLSCYPSSVKTERTILCIIRLGRTSVKLIVVYGQRTMCVDELSSLVRVHLGRRTKLDSSILVPRGRDFFGQHQKQGALAGSEIRAGPVGVYFGHR